MSARKFSFVLLLVLPTYVWHSILAVGAVGAALGERAGADAGINSMATATYFLLLISYVIMIFVSYRRGVANNRKFLLAFLIVGGFLI